MTQFELTKYKFQLCRTLLEKQGRAHKWCTPMDPHMAKQKQDDQLEHTYSSYVRIWDVALKTCLRRWTIGRSGERGSGKSVWLSNHTQGEAKYWCVSTLWPTIVLINQSSYYSTAWTALVTIYTQQTNCKTFDSP